MTAPEFKSALAALGMDRADAAAMFVVSTRTVSRWSQGKTPVPPLVERELRVKMKEVA